MYAEYTYAPADRILNGFIQALVGLYDYTAITKDPLGLKLFEAGDAEARAIVPHYDTGAWSLYDQFGESDLNYHELLTEFLQHLCERTRKGPPMPASTPVAPPPTTTPPAPESASGGAKAPPQTHDPGRSDLLHDRPALHRRPAHPAGGLAADRERCAAARARACRSRCRRSRRSRSTVRQGAGVVWTNSATVERGQPEPAVADAVEGRHASPSPLTATDLAGNFATAQGTIALAAH